MVRTVFKHRFRYPISDYKFLKGETTFVVKTLNRLAIVTGTSKGIGRALAVELLNRGWNVVGLARGKQPSDLKNPLYIHHRLDVGDLEALNMWCRSYLGDQQLSEHDRIGLVNNAAFLEPVGPTTSLASQELSNQMAVNFIAPTYMTGFVLEHSPTQTPITVINLSSGAATKAQPGWTGYCASKAALRIAGEVLAAEVQTYPELLKRKLSVVTYAPNVVDTQMQEDLRAMEETRFPDKQRFVDLNREGILVPAHGPAIEMSDLLEHDGLPPYSELRYHPPT